MSEPFAERLSRLTPESSGLDRDRLLIAAGRASARSGRYWMISSAVLAASQILTLVLLWPKTPATEVLKEPSDGMIISAPAANAPDPSSWSSLQSQVTAAEGNLTSPPSDQEMTPSEPPLHAFAPLPRSLLD